MTGHKPFSELTKGFSPRRKAKIAALTNQLREEMTLQELREALNLHQTDLTASLFFIMDIDQTIALLV